MPELLRMGRRFHAMSGMAMGFDDDAVAAFVGNLIASPRATVIIDSAGMIGGTLVPAYCDPRWLIAVELFWWADRGGLGLLRAFERWATAAGAHEIRMTSLAAHPRAGSIMERLGYHMTEISHTKAV